MILYCMAAEQNNPDPDKYKKIEIDEAIFQKIAENDLNAFEEFFNMTQKSVYSYALSILRNHEDALDILQETYLKIRGAAHLYEPMGKPMAWVFTIARNLAMSKIREGNKTETVPPDTLEDDPSFSYITDREDFFILQAALKILDLEEREIILLHAVSGFKHREIADHLSLSLGTVLSKYHRGIHKLRKYLKEQGVQS